MSSEEVVCVLPVSDSGLTWWWMPLQESSTGVSVLPTLQGLSTGCWVSLGGFGELISWTSSLMWAGMALLWGCFTLLPSVFLQTSAFGELTWVAFLAAGASLVLSPPPAVFSSCTWDFWRLCLGLDSRWRDSSPSWFDGCVLGAASWAEGTNCATSFCSTASPEPSFGPGSVSQSAFLLFPASFPLGSDCLEAAAAVAEVLEVLAAFGEDFSVENSVVLFGFDPDLAAATEDCLEGAEEAFAGLVLDFAETPVAETGFVIFFLGVSLTVLSVADGFEGSLPSSFLGEAVFLMEDPCLEP